MKQTIEELCDVAREIGCEHADNAASWTTDGNGDVEHYRRILQMLDDGDPAAYDYLPARPDLSGEMADSYTITTLLSDVTFGEAESLSEKDREAIISAWEAAVSERFETACEEQLREMV